MGLFGRRRAKGEPSQQVDLDHEETGELDDGPVDEAGPDVDVDEAEDHEMEAPYSRLRGPFDSAEVTPDTEQAAQEFIDLGSLRIPAVPGIGLRLEVEDTSQVITGVHVVLGTSMVQLQAYAAPRTFGVWKEIRTEIGQGVLGQGGKVEISDGPFGKQLTAVLKGGQRMRFFGIDGPRWFLRAVLSGTAAGNDREADPLVEIVRKVVVVRGADAMAPRELLPLRMPVAPEPAEPTGATETNVHDEPSAARPTVRSTDDLRPFERGPEITEVH